MVHSKGGPKRKHPEALSIKPRIHSRVGEWTTKGRWIEKFAKSALLENKPVDSEKVAAQIGCSVQFARTTLAYHLKGLMAEKGIKEDPWNYIVGGNPKQGGKK